MPMTDKPRSHFAGVFANACEFGGKVDAVQKNFQVANLFFNSFREEIEC
ncbi:hypothetical protein [Rhodoferax sp. BLA1]